jgi:phosphoribosylaminoimidazolecarboxamide formyltransferase/IMP cyclohydrolase
MGDPLTQIRKALISVSRKDGLADFANGLSRLQVELISTGGTAKFLKEVGISVREVSEVTGFPEILDGRVKTLHPRIHGGLLAIRANLDHQRQLLENTISPIDMVVVNLYPFAETVAKPGVTFEEAIENIDIGGPAMIRSAAKNFNDVVVIVSPEDYGWILEELTQNSGHVSLESRFKLAGTAFQLTATYDMGISTFLSRMHFADGRFQVSEEVFPQKLYLALDKVGDLRYGENPHQRAAFFRESSSRPATLPDAMQLQGKELSFNNIFDLNSAHQLASEFETACAVIVKHNNPCGVGISQAQADAYTKARDCDPVSAFGSVLGFNRMLTKETAQEVILTFVEAIIAPGYEDEALNLLGAKKNLRLLKYSESSASPTSWDYKRIEGGMLVQDVDQIEVHEKNWRVVSRREPTTEEWAALRFAWRVVKHVKSNAIVYANAFQTVGIGAGQMSRVDSARIGISKAILPIKGCVMASDAFFPFRDGIDVAAAAGIKAVIQPGGSVRDDEVIGAAEEHGMAMVMTGTRHFRH